MQTTVDQLQAGQLFKFNARQRKWRTFIRALNLPVREGIPEEDQGKVLVVFDACKQKVIEPNQELIVTQLA